MNDVRKREIHSSCAWKAAQSILDSIVNGLSEFLKIISLHSKIREQELHLLLLHFVTFKAFISLYKNNGRHLISYMTSVHCDPRHGINVKK